MQAISFEVRSFSLRIATPIAFVTLLGCAQPPTPMTTPTAQTTPQDRAVPSSTNRILARLDGLTGDSDPRLSALRARFTQLGFTVMAMGVSPTTSTTTQPAGRAPNHSAMIVVAVDLAKNDMGQAMAQFRLLETFAYVEADQLMQQRK